MKCYDSLQFRKTLPLSAHTDPLNWCPFRCPKENSTMGSIMQLRFALMLGALIPGAAIGGLVSGLPGAKINDPSVMPLALTCGPGSDNCGKVAGILRTAPVTMTASLAAKGLRIKYLGSGGVYIERCVAGTCEAIMTSPFFSQHSLLTLGFCEVRSAPDTVKKYMDKLLSGAELGRVEAVLAGHSHHDHILDLPEVLANFATGASAFGSKTMRNILRGSEVPEIDLVAMNDTVITAETAAGSADWTYIPNQSIRFVALESKHTPNFDTGIPFLSFNFAMGTVGRSRGSLPRRPRGWKEGQVLAFVIDFLEAPNGSDVKYRFYYQDTPFAPPTFHGADSFVTLGLDTARREVDMAIACVATANFEDSYFAAMNKQLSPDFYYLSHWEDFFKGYTLDAPSLTAVSVTDPSAVIIDLLQQVPGAVWVLPAPGTELR